MPLRFDSRLPITDNPFEHVSQQSAGGITLTILRSQHAVLQCRGRPRGALARARLVIVVPYIRRNAFHKAARYDCISDEAFSIGLHFRPDKRLTGCQNRIKVFDHGFEISHTVSTFTVTLLRHRNGRTFEGRNGALFVFSQR